MSLSTQHIIRHLFRVESLEEVSRQQLEQLVEEYPSFGVGRYLLSRKLQTENADHFKKETQKTNLYFSNPFWLQWLLQAEAPAAVAATVHSEVVPVPPETVTMDEDNVPEETFVALADPGTEVVEHSLPEEQPMAQPEEWDAAGEAALPAEEVFAPVVDTTEPTVGPSAADELMKSIAAFQEQRRAEMAPEVEEEAPSMGIAGLALEQTEEGNAVEVIASVEDPVEVQEVPVETKPEVETLAAAVEQSPVDQIAPVQEQQALFEPYHTVDYFASQGIRLVMDENPTDRLGKQMKSFTDWLKVMRRLPQKNREIIPDIAAEHQVQAIAAHSIERGEVITETMAEVLAMQGMREKATEMYRKLSLLEPEKSAYFADKIEQLKII